MELMPLIIDWNNFYERKSKLLYRGRTEFDEKQIWKMFWIKC